MKNINFRPLRRVRKTGKIAVAAYDQWYKIKCAALYGGVELYVDPEYRLLPVDEYVHNHLGVPLFFWPYKPDDIAVFQCPVSMEYGQLQREFLNHAIRYSEHSWGYRSKGLDVDGTPYFSHLTIDYIAEHYKDFADYEPLTVGVVLDWYGWFLQGLKTVKFVSKSEAQS